jgi:hypothetical protein
MSVECYCFQEYTIIAVFSYSWAFHTRTLPVLAK